MSYLDISEIKSKKTLIINEDTVDFDEDQELLRKSIQDSKIKNWQSYLMMVDLPSYIYDSKFFLEEIDSYSFSKEKLLSYISSHLDKTDNKEMMDSIKSNQEMIIEFKFYSCYVLVESFDFGQKMNLLNIFFDSNNPEEPSEQFI